MTHRVKVLGSVPITHEALKKMLGINETADITGILYLPTVDVFTICLRPVEGRDVTFGGQDLKAFDVTEGTILSWMTEPIHHEQVKPCES